MLKKQGENLGNFKVKTDEVIFVGCGLSTKTYRVYNLTLNIFIKSIHLAFDDKKIQGLLDEGNYETLHFENEVDGEIDDNDDEIDEPTRHRNSSININQSTNNLSVDTSTSTENILIDNPSMDNGQSKNRSINSRDVSQSNQAESKQNQPSKEDEVTPSRKNLTSQRKWVKSHPVELIIDNANDGVKTRSATRDECIYSSFLPQ